MFPRPLPASKVCFLKKCGRVEDYRAGGEDVQVGRILPMR